ncbi:MAG: glycosyltransferase [Acidobacteriia bacterium]|jgi:glycosyltransferase involved in cell wall biosynthesis|nr:glycosyltransferase [Terriglobia bacterium]
MRILMVSQVYDPFHHLGGPAFKVRALAEHLARRGQSVAVLTTSLGPQQPPGRVWQGSVEAIYLKPWLRYRATTWNAGLVSFCRRELRRFELVHIFGLYDLLGPIVARFCRRWRIPYLIEPLGMTRPIDRSFRLKRLWHGLFGDDYLHRARALVATSEQEQEELLAEGFPAEQIFLRYNGLDLNQFRELPPRGAFRRRHGIAPEEPLLLFLGRLIPRKGADLAIEAFARALPTTGHLVIAGPEGEVGYLHTLKRMSERSGCAERVLFTGALFDREKLEALVDADVFLLPSRYENFANTAAEAVACGTPVIITEHCGISRLVADRVGLVVPREVSALTEAIRRLISDAELHERFRRACPEFAARLSWETLSQVAEQHYLHLLDRQNARD